MYLCFLQTRLKLKKSAFILYRTLVSISNSEGTVRKNALKNMISSKGLKMRMSYIKLSVHLTIEYTISGNVFVLILKLMLSALQWYLSQADICSMGEDIGRKPQASTTF